MLLNKVSNFVVSTAVVLVLLSSRSTAQDSVEERVQAMTAMQSRIAELQAKAENAPDDRGAVKTLLLAGIEYYELITRSRFSESARKDLVELKIVMQDMFSIQRAIGEMGNPYRLSAEQLTERLKSMKVPFGHRRSVPLVDPWGTPYRFFVDRVTGTYKLISAGRSKKFDAAELGLSTNQIGIQAPERRSASLDDNIVFIDGRNFTRIFDYPKEAQSFLYTFCEPADFVRPTRCW